jgi:hypothetical protein
MIEWLTAYALFDFPVFVIIGLLGGYGFLVFFPVWLSIYLTMVWRSRRRARLQTYVR